MLDGLDLTVAPGSVYALLGPNGAGKSTFIRILTTLAPADGGVAEVAGHDVAAHPDDVRRSISVTGQATAVDELLTGRENVRMIARVAGLASVATPTPAPTSCSPSSTSSTRPTSGPARTRAGCAAASTSPPAWS